MSTLATVEIAMKGSIDQDVMFLLMAIAFRIGSFVALLFGMNSFGNLRASFMELVLAAVGWEIANLLGSCIK